MTVGIVGLGLIGGSMAKSVKSRTGHRVLGLDKNAEAVAMAKMSGSIDGDLTADSIGECGLVLAALPPKALLSWVEENAEYLSSDAILIDLCGVKRAICGQIAPIAASHGFSYIGGHPMAGKEVSGFSNADDELFRGASMILTPDERTDMRMLDFLKEFFLQLGFGQLTFTTPEEHDRRIAYTSQLAHVTSSAYIKSPTAQQNRGFSAGSYMDMTRVARLDENLWTELFLANADNLTNELELLIDNLSQYLNALKTGDAESLRALLKEGREMKLKAGGN